MIPFKIYNYYNNNNNYTPAIFLGFNGVDYPSLCMLISTNHANLTNWVYHIDLKPIDKDMKDYIIDNKLIYDIFNCLKNKNFSSGSTTEGINDILIERLKEYLLSDDRINIHMEMDKYNL